MKPKGKTNAYRERVEIEGRDGDTEMELTAILDTCTSNLFPTKTRASCVSGRVVRVSFKRLTNGVLMSSFTSNRSMD